QPWTRASTSCAGHSKTDAGSWWTTSGTATCHCPRLPPRPRGHRGDGKTRLATRTSFTLGPALWALAACAPARARAPAPLPDTAEVRALWVVRPTPADSLPTDSTHFIYRRPDLLAVPRPLARELYDADPRDPHYVQALAEYARANRDHVEGLYTSPAAPDVKEHLYSVWIDLVERYQLDGLHFDYVRYPAPDYDYSRVALERFRDWLVPALPDSVRTRFAALEPADPLVHSDSFPDAWDRFRRLQITELVERIYHGVKKRNPRLIVSAAVFGDADNAYRLRFQDWRDWLRRDIIDRSEE